ncbi:YybS family protein [Thalassobacillus pellis]|uniref:YybS family protein n=1 Tax=Thalassobacillus pellis TaxID=748008 RepID=UPI00195FF8A0|nr:YybS family protein [Thalassobacillus pellis]MBM7552181.1 uncharacterized protein YybS (DUF2232 family) [Thalassobacillus pellis]
MMGSRQITEGALMTGLYLILLLINVFVPFIGAVVFFVLPVPFILYSYRHGWKPGLTMLIVAAILSSLFATIYSLPVTLMIGSGGLFVGAAMHRKRSAYETWAAGTVGFTLGIVSLFLITQLLFDINWIEEIRTLLDESFSMTEQMMKNFMGSSETSDEQLQALREQIRQFPDIIPSLFAIMGIAMAFLSQWIGYKIINRIDQQNFHFTKFRNYKLPTAVLWYYFLGMIASWMFTESDNMIYIAGLNIFIVTGLLIALQGFAFIFYYAYVKKLSKAVPIISVVITILFPGLLLYLIRILGIIDIGFSLRERIKGK